MEYNDVDILVPVSDGLDTSKIEHFNIGGELWGMRLKSGATVTDDFADGSRGFPWTTTWGDPVESGGVLNISIPTATADYEGYDMGYDLAGDFDVQVDFGGYLAAGSGVTFTQLELKINNSNLIRMNRQTDGGTDEWYSTIRISGMSWNFSASTAVTSGKLRVKRVGSVVTTYYDAGAGWVQLDSRSAFTTDISNTRMFAYTDASTSLSVWFDNFVLIGGSFYAPDSPSPGDPGWLSLSVGSIIQRATAELPEDIDGSDTGSVEIAEAVNGGGWGSWQSLAAYQAAGDAEITDPNNSYKALVRLNSDGTQPMSCCRYLKVSGRLMLEHSVVGKLIGANVVIPNLKVEVST